MDWLRKESNIQKLTRIRKSVDWLYQDPEHTTEAKPAITTSKRRVPFSTANFQHPPKQTMNMEEVMHVLDSLNMSTIHENSQQFKNPTIGDVGVILWGSPSATKTIDFKTKLAEVSNLTSTATERMNEPKGRIIAKKSNLKLDVVNHESIVSTVKEKKEKEEKEPETTTFLLPSSTENSSSLTEITSELNVLQIETVESSTKLSNMDRIMGTAPSLNEDHHIQPSNQHE